MTSVVTALISAVCAVLCNFASLCKTGFVLNISERNQILIFKCLVCSRGQCWCNVSSLDSEVRRVVSHAPQWSRESWGLCCPLSIPHCAIVKVLCTLSVSQPGWSTLLSGWRLPVDESLCTTGYSRVFPSQTFGTPCAQ